MNTQWEYYKRQYMHCDFDVLGSEGWELAAVITDPSHTGYGQYMCVFKRPRIAALESRSPANEVQDAEREQWRATVEQQKAKIEDIERDRETLYRRIAELEKQLADETKAWNDLNFICGGRLKQIGALQLQVESLDGKTPGDVFTATYLSGGEACISKLGIETRAKMNLGAKAVLDTFGKQQTREALERVRDRIATECSIGVDPLISKHAARGIINDELAKLGMEKPASEVPFCFLCGKGPHDHEMMVLESLPKQFEVQWCNGKRQNFGTEKPHWWDKPTSDHVHELGSCSFCDKSPPDTSTESGLPDAVLAAITLPTKPTKPLRERLEDLASYWEKGAASSSMSEGYRQASKDCAKELREAIDDPR